MWRLTKDKKYRYTRPFEKYFGLGIFFLVSDLQNYSDASLKFRSDQKTMLTKNRIRVFVKGLLVVGSSYAVRLL
jgi:hypothetical protein